MIKLIDASRDKQVNPLVNFCAYKIHVTDLFRSEYDIKIVSIVFH
jgi:hypothetical protein